MRGAPPKAARHLVIVVGHPSEADRRALVALNPSAPILDAAGELSRELSEEEREVLAPVIVLARE